MLVKQWVNRSSCSQTGRDNCFLPTNIYVVVTSFDDKTPGGYPLRCGYFHRKRGVSVADHGTTTRCNQIPPENRRDAHNRSG
jgi:hypothetical protein